MNMVLKSLQPFLVHIDKILEMSLCWCMCGEANERKMERERDGDRDSLGVISIYNEEHSMLVTPLIKSF